MEERIPSAQKALFLESETIVAGIWSVFEMPEDNYTPA